MAMRRVLALLAVCLGVCGGARADETQFGLRVVAANDSPAQQARKLAVRDAVLDALEARLQALKSHEARAEALYAFVPEAVLLAGGAREASASVRKTAPDGSPCLTLTVVLGAGMGANWFGLLCPEVMDGFAQGEGVTWRVQDVLRCWLLVPALDPGEP